MIGAVEIQRARGPSADKTHGLVRALLGAAIALFGSAAAGQCEVGKLTVADSGPNEGFGYSVALDADVAIIGLPGDDHHSSGGLGSAYVFMRCGPTWLPTAKLRADDGEIGDEFGWCVAVSGDIAAIGAVWDDELGDQSGSAYVFERSPTGEWLQGAKLVPDDGAEQDFFGYSVALSGGVAVVGAVYDCDHGIASGSAYVFECGAGGNWSQVAKLLASDAGHGDQFGDAVAIDRDVIVIGAPGDDDQGNWSGSAYVFERDGNGNWSQVAKLLADDGTVFDSFGESVAIEGDTALIGASEASGFGYHCGAAYVFRRDEDGTWSQRAKLAALDGEVHDDFGYAVGLSGDVALIGARNDDDDGLHSGSAYVFVREADANWPQVAKLTASDAAPDDWFGEAVSVSANMAIIGAWGNDDYGPKSGAAYMFAVGPDEDADGLMDACECPGDLNHDWIVDYYDLAVLLADWDCDDPHNGCLLYTSPSPRDRTRSRMPSSA